MVYKKYDQESICIQGKCKLKRGSSSKSDDQIQQEA